MYKLLIKHFLRQRSTQVASLLLLILGLIAIGIGKQFLMQQERNVRIVEETQERQLKKQLEAHSDDLGLMLFYQKFAFVNDIDPMAGLAIGQADLNNNIEHVTILALEGQKYDTDLVSPIKLQVGNLDLSFVITFLFPLVIIALMFNLWHEEVERGTWKMIQIQGQKPYRLLIAKFIIRVVLVLIILLSLFILAKVILAIPLSWRLVLAFTQSMLYVLFWFAICLCMIGLKQTSSINAVSLLGLWLLLTILIPAGINIYITNRYPIGEALQLTLKQRDSYHKKWDSDKRATVDKFNLCYPQYSSYKLQDSGFTWHWYYAMQHMGDLESREEQQQMLNKVAQREALSERIASFLPSAKVQLNMNKLAYTDLSSYLAFLEATTKFHERKRLSFYAPIFEKQTADGIDWSQQVPEHYLSHEGLEPVNLLFSLCLFVVLFLLIGLVRLRSFV